MEWDGYLGSNQCASLVVLIGLEEMGAHGEEEETAGDN